MSNGRVKREYFISLVETVLEGALLWDVEGCLIPGLPGCFSDLSKKVQSTTD